MGVSGDFGALEAIRRQMARLGQEGRARVVKATANEGQLLVQEGFEAGRAPSGAPWAPVKRGGQPLRDTGRMFASLTPKVSGTGFVIETNVVYAETHQKGATVKAKKAKTLGRPGVGWFGVSVTIPARPFLPDGDTLPAPWETRLTEAAQDAIQILFK